MGPVVKPGPFCYILYKETNMSTESNNPIVKQAIKTARETIGDIPGISVNEFGLCDADTGTVTWYGIQIAWLSMDKWYVRFDGPEYNPDCRIPYAMLTTREYSPSSNKRGCAKGVYSPYLRKPILKAIEGVQISYRAEVEKLRTQIEENRKEFPDYATLYAKLKDILAKFNDAIKPYEGKDLDDIKDKKVHNLRHEYQALANKVIWPIVVVSRLRLNTLHSGRWNHEDDIVLSGFYLFGIPEDSDYIKVDVEWPFHHGPCTLEVPKKLFGMSYDELAEYGRGVVKDWIEEEYKSMESWSKKPERAKVRQIDDYLVDISKFERPDPVVNYRFTVPVVANVHVKVSATTPEEAERIAKDMIQKRVDKTYDLGFRNASPRFSEMKTEVLKPWYEG